MPTYAWRAYDIQGRVQRGSQRAPDLRSLAETLTDQELHVFSTRETNATEKRVYRGRIPRRELIHFTEQLSIVVRSGIPILSGLEEMHHECRHVGFKAVLGNILERVADGQTLSKAMEAYPRIFDDAYTGVVAAGEESGSLDDALENMAEQMTWAQDTARQVRGALIQPAILLLAVTGLTILVVAVLVPKITDLFARNGTTLPGITQALVTVSGFIRGWWPALLLGLLGTVVAWQVVRRLPPGRYAIDHLKLRIPVLGRIIELFAASRFVNLFSLLNDAGVAVVRNLEIVQKATGNAVFNRGVRRLRRTITMGGTIADGIASADVFPPLVVRMMRIGEQTGELSDALRRICTYYDKETPRALKKVTTLLQPILLMVSAAVVCFVIFAAFMPIVKLVSGAH